MLVKGGNWKRSAAEAGVSGGGGGFASELCKGFFTICLARPATSQPRCGGLMCRALPPTLTVFYCICEARGYQFVTSVGSFFYNWRVYFGGWGVVFLPFWGPFWKMLGPLGPFGTPLGGKVDFGSILGGI